MYLRRACAEAWAVGGSEGEGKERELWKTSEIEEAEDAVRLTHETVLELRRAQEQREHEKNGMHCYK